MCHDYFFICICTHKEGDFSIYELALEKRADGKIYLTSPSPKLRDSGKQCTHLKARVDKEARVQK